MKILETGDGSKTLYNETLRETYHSVHGALGESVHVYINNGLQVLQKKQSSIRILEIGFGTGLNALLTLDSQLKDCNIIYHSLEPFPPETQLLREYYAGFSAVPVSLPLLDALLGAESLRSVRPGFDFCLHGKKLEDFNCSELDGPADLVYYDAFAPSKQPELWNCQTLDRVKQCMKPGGLLVTYCAQGQFKRNLKALGFEVTSPPGAHGKREMTVAILCRAGEFQL